MTESLRIGIKKLNSQRLIFLIPRCTLLKVLNGCQIHGASSVGTILVSIVVAINTTMLMSQTNLLKSFGGQKSLNQGVRIASSGDSKTESLSLSFPASRGRLHSLAHGPFSIFKTAVQHLQISVLPRFPCSLILLPFVICPSLTLTLLPPFFYKTPEITLGLSRIHKVIFQF